MNYDDIRWIKDLNIGDTIYYKYDDYNKHCKIKKSTIKGISKKCIYVDDFRLRKDRLISIFKTYFGYKETLTLINPKNITEDQIILAEKDILEKDIIDKKMLSSLSIEDLKEIINKYNRVNNIKS